MHVAHKWSAAAELVHPFYTGVKFLPFIVSCGCSLTARLMWQKWFLVVGFPKHEPIFFFNYSQHSQ